MRLSKALTLLAAGLFLPAFFPSYSHEVTLVLLCEPIGADVYTEVNGKLGTCPMYVKYNWNDDSIKDDRLNTKRFNVVWHSGVSMLIPPQSLEIDRDTAVMMFIRPEDAPYLSNDLAYSKAFDESVQLPNVAFVSTPYEDRDIFATFNHGASCFFESIIMAKDASCP